MEKIFLIILQLLSLIQLTHAGVENHILEGTYVGNSGNRANISSYRDQGIYNYDLLLTNIAESSAYQLSTVQKRPMETGKVYRFKTRVSPYHDDMVSECSIHAKFEHVDELELIGDMKCVNEKSLLGQFVFSEQASFIPQQYWGRWGKTSQCDDVTAIIQKTWLTNDSDWGAAIVLNTNDEADGGIEIYGIEEYEDILSDSRFNLQLKHNKLYLTGSHHASDFEQVLVKCSEQAF